MINITNKADCCGCNACGDVCAKHAITFKTDNEGFWYPEVNKDLCVDCGLCEKVCPIAAFDRAETERLQALDVLNKDNMMTTNSPLQILAAHHIEIEIRNSSSSGGVFSALSDYIISQGGIVYGAVYDRQNNVLHEPAYTSEECLRFRGSKYVQSCVLSNYKVIQKQLFGGGKIILFS